MIETNTTPSPIGGPALCELTPSDATETPIPAALEALASSAATPKDCADLEKKITPPPERTDSDRTGDDEPIAHVMAGAPKPDAALKSPTPLRSLSTEDLGCLTDATLNPIHATCFEIGAALAILEQPGTAGLQMDTYALQLREIIDQIYDTPLGDTTITFGGKTMTLKDYFNTKLLAEIRPSSDQIGRCTDPTKTDTWLAGTGKAWLRGQLSIASTDPDYTPNNMLTKIRMLSAFGTVAREMHSIPANKVLLASLLKKDVSTLDSRASEITTQIRHADFDSPATRLRSERPPIIDDSALLPTDARLGERGFTGPVSRFGFGMIYDQEQFPDRALAEKYTEKERAHGRNGMPRHGQPISDLSRPGIISEEGLERMPQAFKDAGLLEKLRAHRLPHGTGVNRWELTGTYAKQSWSSGHPSAGAHSGGTSDIFLALNCLDSESLLGDVKKCFKAGLLVSSFMNFGGYHTFNETFPIAVNFGRDEKFHVAGSRNSNYKLYEGFTTVASYFCPGAREAVVEYKAAYRASIAEAAQEKDLQGKRALIPEVRFGKSKTVD